MTLREHDVDVQMNWCRRCGRPWQEIFEQDLANCDGLEGVEHARYREARRKANALFDPVLKSFGIDP